MGEIELKALISAPTGLIPLTWKRFTDDIFH